MGEKAGWDETREERYEARIRELEGALRDAKDALQQLHNSPVPHAAEADRQIAHNAVAQIDAAN